MTRRCVEKFKIFKKRGAFKVIYLDYAATTPMDEVALDVFVKASRKYYGNPSSLHNIGSEANTVLDVCRGEIAKLINGQAEGVYFTSGGSQSNILAIRSLVDGNSAKGNHLITTEVEHSSVYNVFQMLEAEGYDVTYLPIDSSGKINIKHLKEAIREDTILASIHHGNSEIGTIQSLEEIGQLLKKKDILFHTDCVQTFGKVSIDLEACHIDSLSLSSHKIYGPKGVGACYIRPEIRWTMQVTGTTHEKGLTPGTVNVPGILAFTTAAQQMTKRMKENELKCHELRKRFIKGLTQIDHDICVYGHLNSQLPSIIGLTVAGVQGQYVMLEFNRYGIAISTGSACQVGQQNPSRTMLSMGKNADEAKQFIRISLGSSTEVEHIDKLLQTLKMVVNKI